MPQEFFRLARFCVAVGAFAVLAACGGGGGGGNGGGGGGGSVTVSGRITFDRLPFNTTANTGLNGAAPVESPAREVVVEAVSSNATLAATNTDADGNYSFTVPANTSIAIRARAQMLKTGAAPTWNFIVRNNFNSDAVYALQGDSFNTGTSNVTRNLRAASGWGGTSYTDTRAAAPFAILDTVYLAKQLVLGALPAAAFPDLNLYWSERNRTANSPFCPDDGNIGTSFYTGDPQERDGCAGQGNVLPVGIYILGEFVPRAGDTDEFDAHVIAHEFGHYLEDRFGRSDSIGGIHNGGDRLDLRLAFSEGWGNAFAGMTLNDPLYRDSSSGIGGDFAFSVESDSTINEGWFSEASVGEILWDVFDSNTPPESGDNIALGFGPTFAVMTGAQATTDALISVFSFAAALRSANAGSAAAIDELLDNENINASNAFAAGETNNGGDPTNSVLPIYGDIVLNTPKTNVCSLSFAGSTSNNQLSVANKLGNRRFLRFENDVARTVTITATGETTNPAFVGATDPDILVFRRGVVVAAGLSGADNAETISQFQLAAGTYILDVYDYDLVGTNQPPRCMTVAITGN